MHSCTTSSCHKGRAKGGWISGLLGANVGRDHACQCPLSSSKGAFGNGTGRNLASRGGGLTNTTCRLTLAGGRRSFGFLVISAATMAATAASSPTPNTIMSEIPGAYFSFESIPDRFAPDTSVAPNAISRRPKCRTPPNLSGAESANNMPRSCAEQPRTKKSFSTGETCSNCAATEPKVDCAHLRLS